MSPFLSYIRLFSVCELSFVCRLYNPRSPDLFGLGTSTVCVSLLDYSTRRCIEFHGRKGMLPLLLLVLSINQCRRTTCCSVRSPKFTPRWMSCLHIRYLRRTDTVKKVSQWSDRDKARSWILTVISLRCR